MCYCIDNAYCYFFMTFNSLSDFMEFAPIFWGISGVKPLFSRTIKKQPASNLLHRQPLRQP